MASDRMENTLLIGVLVVGVVATLGWAFVVFRDFRKAWEDYNGMAKRVVVLDAASISYVEVFGHRLVIHVLGGRTEQLSLSLTQAREILPKENFIQCHRSYVVNKDMVSSMRRYEVALFRFKRTQSNAFNRLSIVLFVLLL